MIDPALLLDGGFLVGAGFILGRIPGRRRRPKPVKPICGCTHHYSYHDPKTGECHGSVENDVPVRDQHGGLSLDGYGITRTMTELTPCKCRRYSGPVPLPEFMANELSDTPGG